METEKVVCKYGELIFDFQENEKEEKFVGNCRVSLILNEEFLKKFRCFNINFRGNEHYRLKDKDVEMLFAKD